MAHNADGAVGFVGISYKQGYAPYRAQADDSVDDPAENARLTAADPRDEIELEDADGSPVDAADDERDQ